MKAPKKGYALILVILALAVLSIIGTAFLFVSLSENKMVSYQNNKIKGYYAARAGADALASYIIQNPNTVTGPGLLDQTGSGNVNGYAFDTTVKRISPYILQIDSKSYRFGDSTKNIISEISLTMTSLAGMFTNGFLICHDYNPDNKTNTEVHGDQPVEGIDMSIFPDTNSALFPSINNVAQLKTTGIYYEKVTNLSGDIIKTNSIFTGVTSPAELHLFVSSSLNDIGDVIPPAGVALYIYYNGTNVLTKNGKFAIERTAFYAPNATFDINGGGNGTFYGMVISNIIVPPNSNADFYESALIDISRIIPLNSYTRTKWSAN